jgi:Domain of unknown function (DUF5658)
MKYLLFLLLCVAVQAQDLSVTKFALPDALAPRPHLFWTFENKVETSVLAGLVAADAITTQRGLNEGLREMNPVMRPLVTRGAGGQAASSAVGFAAAMGFAYWLHRTNHYKAERITMRLMVVGEAGFVANNIVEIR